MATGFRMATSVVLLSISFLLLQVTILPSTSAYASATTTNNGESKETSAIVHSTIVLGEEGWENGSPSSIALNEKTNFVYVANRNSDTVVVIDGTTNKVVDSITVGFSPADVAVNPNTNFIYVTKLDVGTVSVIDGSTNRIIKNIEIDDSINFHHAGGIAVNENTNKIYVLTNNYPAGQASSYYASISIIDGLTNELESFLKVTDLRVDYDVQDSARDIAINSETNTIYVVFMFGDVYVIDADTNKVSGKMTIGYGKTPHQVEVNEETDMVYVSNFNNQSISVIDGSTNEIKSTVPVGVDPQGIAINSAANIIYVITYAGEVSVIDGLTLEPKGKIAVGQHPERAAFNNNDGLLYVTNTGSNSVSVIDTTVPKSGQAKAWKTIHVLGKFLNSDPPKPDQLFQVHYRVINGTAESFDMNQEIQDVIMNNVIVARVSSISDSGDGILEIKFPRNFPYSNGGSGVGMFDINFVNGMHDSITTTEDRQATTTTTTTDCFFEFAIPFRGKGVEIEVGMASILIKAPYQGDSVSESCMPQTIVETTPDQLEMCSRLGIPEEGCNQIEIDREIARERAHQVALADQERRTMEEQQSQINSSMYMIGVGAAIAGAMAFVLFRRGKS